MNCILQKFYSSRSGSALIAVYSTIAILSIAVFTTLQFLLFEVSHTNSRSAIFRAEQLAHNVAAIAMNPKVEPHDPLLTGGNAAGSYSAVILSEGSKLAINQFATVPRRKVLENLFENWGMDGNEAKDLVDQLIDWVDADSRATGNGRERPFYLARGKPDLPFNRPFVDLDELTLVESYPKLARIKPDWRSFFTLRSSGKLDLSSAPAELIAAVIGCSPTTAEHFVETRSGSDGVALTEDDLSFESVDEALDLLMTYGPDREAILPLCSIDDPVKRIVAVGTVGDIAVEQVWIVENHSSTPAVLDFSMRQLRL
ncbi:MAG: type II secretion system protein GspK [Verrucomicrobiales bacterium]|nr:type II secretion system protein GspK [Verrucomicrobiales bacterium]